MRFHIVIPTLDRATLSRAIASVEEQIFENYVIYIAHDNFDLDRTSVNEPLKRVDIFLKGHHAAGGCRNAAIKFIKSRYYGMDDYILFLDDDDVIANNMVLDRLAEFIEKNNYPDMIRLPFSKYYVDKNTIKTRYIDPAECDISKATISNVVGPPTKAIKANLAVLSPEGMKHQDVVQHIAQCDISETCAVFDTPYFVYNIYDRPDKDKSSPESQMARNTIPKILRETKWHRDISREAAFKWADKIERMYKIPGV